MHPSSLYQAAVALQSALNLCVDKHVVKETHHAQTWRSLLSGIGGAHLAPGSGKWEALPVVDMFNSVSRVLVASAQGNDQMLVSGSLLDSYFQSLLSRQ